MGAGIISNQKQVLSGCKSGNLLFSANCLHYEDKVEQKAAEVVDVKQPTIQETVEISKIVTKEQTKPEDMAKTKVLKKKEDILVVKDDDKKDDNHDEIMFILHSAKNLSNKEMLGKSDPYAKVKYGSQESRTKTIKNNLNPIWEHEVTLKVDKRDRHPINIELFD